MLDGRRVDNGGRWDASGNTFWRDRGQRFVIDLGQRVELADLRLQLDNNDSYLIEHSRDGKRFEKLLKVPAGAGKVRWGIDSFSTVATDPEYIDGLDFTPLNTRYLRISALDGDGDRLMMVDHTGEVVDGDEVLAMIAEHRFKNDGLSKDIVGTLMSNLGLEKAITEMGLKFHRAVCVEIAACKFADFL